MHKHKRLHLYHKEMHEHYASLFEVATKELRYHHLLEQSLYNMIEEIRTLTDDNLVLAVIENWINRYNLDKIIHIKSVFPNPQWFTQEFRDNVLQKKEDTA